MDFDLTSSSAMSSAALGALSALSATSQALSGLQVNYSLFCVHLSPRIAMCKQVPRTIYTYGIYGIYSQLLTDKV